MEESPQSEFTWERYGGRYFGLTEILQFDDKSGCYVLLPQIECVGYIQSKNLLIRPATRGVTILFRVKNHPEDIYWIHCPEFGMEQIIGGRR
jgi:hypothetical protein